MPGETHQIGSDIDADSVLALLQAFLVRTGRPSGPAPAHRGIGGDRSIDLWRAVCEEVGEHTRGSETDADLVDPAMTVAVAASSASTLASGGQRGL
ncbi:MAG: hypothetical protein ACYCV7_05630 [Acidimicrobiales bacterium]